MRDTFLIPRQSTVARLVADTTPTWRAFTRHTFVERLADATLSMSAFRHYLMQDYVFLINFARAWALAAAKADDVETIRECASTLHALIDEEMKLHIAYCRDFGIDRSELEATPEAPANLAYTRYVMDVGLRGDLLDLLVALAPCVIGYGEIGARLGRDPATVQVGNPYAAWIETYAGEEYAGVAQAACRQIDRVAAMRLENTLRHGPRWASLVATFEQATRLEIAFWQMGLDAGNEA